MAVQVVVKSRPCGSANSPIQARFRRNDRTNGENIGSGHWLNLCTATIVQLGEAYAVERQGSVRSYPAMQEDFHTNNGFPRVAGLHKFMRVDLEVQGEPVTVFALHLKSKLGNQITSDGERLAQARMIRRLVRPVLEKGRPKIVVMGDFNDVSGSPTLREIRGLNDASWDLSNAAESEHMNGEAWTYQYRGKKEQIDHVLLSKFLFDEVAAASVIRIDDQASDHDSFAVDIAFGE